MKTLFKLTILTLLVAFLTPVIYFAWRAAQPMELPEYNGLTYYQFLQWRSLAYEELACQYQAAHPDKEVNQNACDPVDFAMDHFVRIPFSMVYPLAAMYPGLKDKLTPFDQAFVPEEAVTAANFLPQWWLGYEKLLLSSLEHNPHTSVAYCRIQPDMPTPEEFEAMQQVPESSPCAP